MNVLLLDQYSDPGGGQLVLLDTLAAIKDRGWRALVGLPGDGEMFDRVRAVGFDARQIACGPYRSGQKSTGDLARFALNVPRLADQIRRMADEVQVDLIYINGPRILPAAAWAKVAKPTLFHSHSCLPSGAQRKLAGRSIRKLNARVVANCRFVGDPWVRALGDHRVSVVYNGVAGPSTLQPRARQNLMRIGCIGRIAVEKGQKEFVQVARKVHAAKPDVRFAIYGAAFFSGDAYEREVRQMAEDLPIEFAGWTNDVYSALSSIDLLLVPSFQQEATTRVILEAFASGVPVIAFAAGGIPEVIEHGVNGYLVRTVDEMADAALSLQPDAFAEAARTTWQERFTLDRYKKEIASVMANAQSEMRLT